MSRRVNTSLVLLLLFIHSTVSLPQSIWDIHIDNDPAPSIKDGPPGSAGAVRDPAQLPLQIGAIVGSYLLWIILISIAVLIVGRRLRRKTQPKPAAPVQQYQYTYGQTLESTDLKEIQAGIPLSPSKEVPWSLKSWASMKKYHSHSGSVATFNESVISEDRQRNEIEMDRLYAAVAEHEQQRSLPASPPNPPLSPLNQNPPEFQHLRYGKQPYDSGLLPSPPPEEELSRSPASSKSPTKRNKPAPLSLPSRESSRSSLSSFASFGRKHNGSVRGLPISPPMGSPEIIQDSRYMESEPLTPRHYNPGPPPTPPAAVPQSARLPPPSFSLASPGLAPMASPLPIDEDGRRYHFQPHLRSSRQSIASNGYTPGQTPRTATFPIYPPPTLQEEQQSYAQSGPVRSNTITFTIDPSSAAPTPRMVPNTPLPQQQTAPGPSQPAANNFSVPRIMSITPPVRTGTGASDSTLVSNASIAGFAGRRTKPAPLALGSTPSASGSQTTLPLRTAPLPLRALRSPNSTRPISTIKNTELHRPDPKADRGLLVPGTAGMVPATPYSPFYMPMTPMTPMTPSRLVTREERKRMKKEEGRKVLSQEDLVEDEGEMWGEGY